LETPLIDLLQACVAGRLDACPPIRWKPEVAACVVAASGGYPGGYEKGKEIRGLEVVERGELGELEGTIVFQAGTQLQDPIQDPESPEQMLVTSGGRVLAVTAFGEDFDQGFDRAYQALRQINFEGIYYRRDIGYQVRKQ
jgi:phosphoribosylamine--glycine ligase